MDNVCNAKLTHSISDSVRVRLKGMVVGGSDAVMIPDLEYITDVFINEDGDLILTTNYSREINAGAVPHGPMGPAGSPGPAGPPGAAGAGLLLVNFRQEDDVWLPDRPLDDLKAALVNGDTVICEYAMGDNILRGQLVFHSEELFAFMCHYLDIEDDIFLYYADGHVEHVTDIGEGSTGVVTEIRLEDGVYVSDKTFEELKPHIEAGDVVVCEFVGADSRTRCPMTTYTDYNAVFVMQSVLGADEYFIFTADGVTHTVAESDEDAEEMPDSVSAVKTDNTITVTATYGLRDIVTTIVLDDNDSPMSVTKDGKNCALNWSGFDE